MSWGVIWRHSRSSRMFPKEGSQQLRPRRMLRRDALNMLSRRSRRSEDVKKKPPVAKQLLVSPAISRTYLSHVQPMCWMMLSCRCFQPLRGRSFHQRQLLDIAVPWWIFRLTKMLSRRDLISSWQQIKAETLFSHMLLAFIQAAPSEGCALVVVKIVFRKHFWEGAACSKLCFFRYFIHKSFLQLQDCRKILKAPLSPCHAWLGFEPENADLALAFVLYHDRS